MKTQIPIPEGLQLPPDANVKPFKLSGMFIAIANALLPLQLEGIAVSQSSSEEESSDEEAQESPEYEAGEEACACCPECGGSGKAKGEGDMGGKHGMDDMEGRAPKGNSFMIAIERSMKKK